MTDDQVRAIMRTIVHISVNQLMTGLVTAFVFFALYADAGIDKTLTWLIPSIYWVFSTRANFYGKWKPPETPGPPDGYST